MLTGLFPVNNIMPQTLCIIRGKKLAKQMKMLYNDYNAKRGIFLRSFFMVSETRENFGKRAAKGLVWWLAGELICIIFNLCMLVFMMKFMAFKVFTAVASSLIANGLLANYAYSCAVRDRNLVKYHGVPHDPLMSLKIAIAAPLPQYICWILLLLSKLGVIKDIFNIFIWCNIQSLAWVDLFTSGRTIDALSWGGLFGLLALMLVAPICIILTYECTIREFDIKAWLFYGKK